jgi:hypothetical protein
MLIFLLENPAVIENLTVYFHMSRAGFDTTTHFTVDVSISIVSNGLIPALLK